MKKSERINTLSDEYNKAVNAYIKEFEKAHDVQIDYWVGDEVGGLAVFGDEFYEFKDIKYVIDKEIQYEHLYDWYYFLVSYGEKCFINLDSYCRLRRDAENKNSFFDLNSFEKDLIYTRVQDI